MKLSEAIRLGSMLRPQAFGAPTDGVGTCALAAAVEALGARMNSPIPREWRLPFLLPPCPACGMHTGDMLGTVIHLNDWHRWTREAIADWVAIIEPQGEHEAAECRSAVDPVEAEGRSDHQCLTTRG